MGQSGSAPRDCRGARRRRERRPARARLQLARRPPTHANPGIEVTIDDLDGKEYVAFVTPDRKKFYRQCFLGFRIKSYPKPEPIERMKNGNKIIEGFRTEHPTVFEISLGRNEFIVHNNSDKDKKKRTVLRIGIFFPVKIFKESTFYIFGTAMLHFNKKSGQEDTIVLVPVPSETPDPDPTKVAQIPSLSYCRDYYRIGVGVEFLGLIKKIFNLL